MTHGGARPNPRRQIHACPDCGTEHGCHTDQCAACREGAVAYEGGWFVQGGVLRPTYPERRSA